MTVITILGPGHIGGNLARLFAAAGHEVTITFSRDPVALAARAVELGVQADPDPASAAAIAEAVVLSVPWAVIDTALAAAGDLSGKLVLDTTNQFGRLAGGFGVLDLEGRSAAEVNAAKRPDALWVKVFNTLTAGFQATAAGRSGADRVVAFYATDHDEVTGAVEELIEAAGFDPVRTGTLLRTDVGHQEPKGDLYGEEFHHDDAINLVAKLRGTEPSGLGRP